MGGKSKRQDRTGPTMTLPVHEKAARKAGVSLYGRTFRVLKKKREKRREIRKTTVSSHAHTR